MRIPGDGGTSWGRTAGAAPATPGAWWTGPAGPALLVLVSLAVACPTPVACTDGYAQHETPSRTPKQRTRRAPYEKKKNRNDGLQRQLAVAQHTAPPQTHRGPSSGSASAPWRQRVHRHLRACRHAPRPSGAGAPRGGSAANGDGGSGAAAAACRPERGVTHCGGTPGRVTPAGGAAAGSGYCRSPRRGGGGAAPSARTTAAAGGAMATATAAAGGDTPKTLGGAAASAGSVAATAAAAAAAVRHP